MHLLQQIYFWKRRYIVGHFVIIEVFSRSQSQAAGSRERFQGSMFWKREVGIARFYLPTYRTTFPMDHQVINISNQTLQNWMVNNIIRCWCETLDDLRDEPSAFDDPKNKQKPIAFAISTSHLVLHLPTRQIRPFRNKSGYPTAYPSHLQAC